MGARLLYFWFALLPAVCFAQQAVTNTLGTVVQNFIQLFVTLAIMFQLSWQITLLTLLAFHQTYHVGQLAISRRIAGLDGAITGLLRSFGPNTVIVTKTDRFPAHAEVVAESRANRVRSSFTSLASFVTSCRDGTFSKPRTVWMFRSTVPFASMALVSACAKAAGANVTINAIAVRRTTARRNIGLPLFAPVSPDDAFKCPITMATIYHPNGKTTTALRCCYRNRVPSEGVRRLWCHRISPVIL